MILGMAGGSVSGALLARTDNSRPWLSDRPLGTLRLRRLRILRGQGPSLPRTARSSNRLEEVAEVHRATRWARRSVVGMGTPATD